MSDLEGHQKDPAVTPRTALLVVVAGAAGVLLMAALHFHFVSLWEALYRHYPLDGELVPEDHGGRRPFFYHSTLSTTITLWMLLGGGFLATLVLGRASGGRVLPHLMALMAFVAGTVAVPVAVWLMGAHEGGQFSAFGPAFGAVIHATRSVGPVTAGVALGAVVLTISRRATSKKRSA